MNDIKELVSIIVRSIIDDEGALSITDEITASGLLLKVSVSKSDTGKVIGKGGRIASAIRAIILAAGRKLDEKVFISIINPEDREL